MGEHFISVLHVKGKFISPLQKLLQMPKGDM